jgi:phage/plasmid-like protein (TIGR03299 family)
MSHQITSQDTPIYVGEPAWHKLGTVMTAEEAAGLTFIDFMRRANLIADVEPYRIFAEVPVAGPNGPEMRRVEFDDFRGLIRTDALTGDLSPLHIHTDSYTEAQDRTLGEALDLVNSMSTDGPLIRPEAAVSLKGHRVTMVTGKFLRTITLPGGDRIEPYAVGINSHDGSFSRKLRSGFIRPECWNMLNRLEAKAGKVDFAIRHTKNAADAFDTAKVAYAGLLTEVSNFEAEARRMIDAEMTDMAFDALVRGVFKPVKDDESSRIKADANVAAVKGLWNDDARVGNYKGTVWGAYQAISTWEQHLVPGKNVAERNVLAYMGAGFPYTAKAAKVLVAV